MAVLTPLTRRLDRREPLDETVPGDYLDLSEAEVGGEPGLIPA